MGRLDCPECKLGVRSRRAFARDERVDTLVTELLTSFSCDPAGLSEEQVAAAGIKEVEAIWLAPRPRRAAAAAGRRGLQGEAPPRLSSGARGRRSPTLEAMLAEDDAGDSGEAEAAAEAGEEVQEAQAGEARGQAGELRRRAASKAPSSTAPSKGEARLAVGEKAGGAGEDCPAGYHPAAASGKRKRGEAGGEEAKRREAQATAAEANEGGETRPVKLQRTALVQRRVQVWWGGDQQWFAGVVTSYSSRRGHQVQYDDGEIKSHWLDKSAEVQWKLLG